MVQNQCTALVFYSAAALRGRGRIKKKTTKKKMESAFAFMTKVTAFSLFLLLTCNNIKQCQQ